MNDNILLNKQTDVDGYFFIKKNLLSKGSKTHFQTYYNPIFQLIQRTPTLSLSQSLSLSSLYQPTRDAYFILILILIVIAIVVGSGFSHLLLLLTINIDIVIGMGFSSLSSLTSRTFGADCTSFAAGTMI
jgi:hypothetical protein